MRYTILSTCMILLIAMSCQRVDDEEQFTDMMDPDDMAIDTMMVDVDTMTMDTMSMDTTTMRVTYSYLALGDSYTIGQGVSATQSFPIQLKAKTSSLERSIDSVKIIAQTGWRTDNLLDAIAAEGPLEYDLVSLLIGVNNQFQNASYFVFQEEFDSLLSIAIDIAGSKDQVFVVSIPDYGVTPFGASNSENIAEALDNYNDFMKVQCDSLDISFIDVTTISRQLGDGENALASDNLHPSEFQYGLWVDEMLPVAIAILDGL